MSAWELPTSIEIAGKEYEIRSDFRPVLDIMEACGNPDVMYEAKIMIMIKILYPGWQEIPLDNYKEAAEKAAAFIDGGIESDGKENRRTMDWMKDAPIMVPAINEVAGKEVRSLPYLHWWTFLGYYMEIKESSLFSQVLQIRQKKASGKRLEKYERKFYEKNKKIIDLEPVKRRSEREKSELRAIFGLKG
ncbi:Gp15 family bacteriophage protein [Blautia sp.]|uniref:Gp15 family bacteriophage protein n=1 Tax=Blautia sp. TaxID=1955243 RepID=UPI002A838D3C|nr:Gp15 family bacteriophage protein [Blautia sp.]MDY4404728.1 Gp15 family bacteriophage protein [Blautia sp.]